MKKPLEQDHIITRIEFLLNVVKIKDPKELFQDLKRLSANHPTLEEISSYLAERKPPLSKELDKAVSQAPNSNDSAKDYDDILLGLYARTSQAIPKKLPDFFLGHPSVFRKENMYFIGAIGHAIYRGSEELSLGGIKTNVEVFVGLNGAVNKIPSKNVYEANIRACANETQVDLCLAFLLNTKPEKGLAYRPSENIKTQQQTLDVVGSGNLLEVVDILANIGMRLKERRGTLAKGRFGPTIADSRFLDPAIALIAQEFANAHGVDAKLCKRMIEVETRLPLGESFKRMKKINDSSTPPALRLVRNHGLRGPK